MASQVSSDQSTSDSPSSGTSVAAILACNSISIAVCTINLFLYIALSLKHKYKRLMRRTSLVLATCMASSDLILHCSNMAGYGDLPPGFACAFVGGWLFAAPTMLSIFYSCCIALNSQLAFVFRRPSPSHALVYFIVVPILVAFVIAFCALGTGTYGYDETWGYCWYATQGISPSTVLIRMLFTYSLPTLLCMLYLLVATVTISIAVFSSPLTPSSGNVFKPSVSDTSSENHTFPPSVSEDRRLRFPAHSIAGVTEKLRSDRKPTSPPDQAALGPSTKSPMSHSMSPKRSGSSEIQPNVQIRVERVRPALSRKALAMRQLTVRLIGYIMTPILCLLPGIILDLLTKVFPDMEVPTALNALFDGLNGLVGLFNSLLMLSDPALLAVWGDLRNSMTADGDGVGERFVRRVLGRRAGGRHANQDSAGGDVHGRERYTKAKFDDDMLASAFARTRIDETEEGEGEESVKGEEHRQNVTSGAQFAVEIDNSHEQAPIQSRQSRRSGTNDGWVRGSDVERGQTRRDPQGLEIHVRVDVTRRMSRVQQVEDWLSGL